jgi:integrase
MSVSYEVILSSPKNHQARVIDIDRATAEQLRAQRLRQQHERDEWGADYADSDLVFCKENGTPLHPQTFTQTFERIVEKSELPRIRLHDLRHTHATIALHAAVPT